MNDIDFDSDRALRAWCLRMGIENNFGIGLDGILETAERYYEFVMNTGIANKDTDNSRIANVGLNQEKGLSHE